MGHPRPRQAGPPRTGLGVTRHGIVEQLHWGKRTDGV
jgi:hypothetical protein